MSTTTRKTVSVDPTTRRVNLNGLSHHKDYVASVDEQGIIVMVPLTVLPKTYVETVAKERNAARTKAARAAKALKAPATSTTSKG